MLLAGSLRAGAMVLESEPLARPNGGTVQHRLTGSRLEDSGVRQHWESSTDAGRTWTSAFDGLYRKASR